MNSLTMLEIINQACESSNQGILTELSEESPLGKQARSHTKRVFQKMLSVYPWPRMTKRVELEDVGNTDSASEFYKRFAIPSDAMYIWDFYDTPNKYRKYSSLWDYTPYTPYTWPYDTLDEILGSYGELVDDHIEGSSSRLYCHYTPKSDPFEVDTTKLTTQFVETMIFELGILFEGKNTQVELKALNISKHEENIRKMKTQSAIENRKSARVPEPTIVSRMRRFMR